ncbi:MAG: UDP-3-O-(3-hydroxymyristoyl)glucosamine N-acyltransferase [candidate division Zixibacteria bacterium]|nr:UDP-3-O-(3-hydroxymyristoyl)glucosamine N-acyltransferase [candidate division Zixibacteria bacterium]
MALTVKELADKIGAEFKGDGDVIIESAAPIESAVKGQISFLSNPAYKKYLAETKASALVLSPDFELDNVSIIVSPNPYLAFSSIISLLYPPDYLENWAIHESAVVSESASISKKVEIGPNVTIEDDVTIEEGTVIKAGTFIGKNSRIGKNCIIAPNVSIMHESKIGNGVIIHAGTVIGSDGFGFAPTEAGQAYKKIRQVGWVEIGDDVEIGANVTVDRGAIGPTVIHSGVKIDNLVQIAHNVQIGENSIIVSQVGISGSTKIGKSVILAGQVGLVGHIEVGDNAMVGAQSGVSRSLEGGRAYFGYPAKPIMETKRIEACLRKLPELLRRVKALETDSTKK